jgi:hypothetical protein
MDIVEKYESKIEGKPPIETIRKATSFDCILSKEELDVNDPGY